MQQHRDISKTFHKIVYAQTFQDSFIDFIMTSHLRFYLLLWQASTPPTNGIAFDYSYLFNPFHSNMGPIIFLRYCILTSLILTDVTGVDFENCVFNEHTPITLNYENSIDFHIDFSHSDMKVTTKNAQIQQNKTCDKYRLEE